MWLEVGGVLVCMSSGDLRWREGSAALAQCSLLFLYPKREWMNYLLWLEGTKRELMVLDEIFRELPQMRIRTTQSSFHKDKFVQFKIHFYLRQ